MVSLRVGCVVCARACASGWMFFSFLVTGWGGEERGEGVVANAFIVELCCKGWLVGDEFFCNFGGTLCADLLVGSIIKWVVGELMEGFNFSNRLWGLLS